MTNLENSHIYCILIDQHVKNYSNPMLIVKIICFVILVVTQYKIEIFSKCVDSKRKFYQLEEGSVVEADDQERNCRYNKINIRIILVILCVLFSVTYFIVGTTESLYIQRLKVMVASSLINFTIIPMLYIATNKNMYCFFKNQVMKITTGTKKTYFQ